MVYVYISCHCPNLSMCTPYLKFPRPVVLTSTTIYETYVRWVPRYIMLHLYYPIADHVVFQCMHKVSRLVMAHSPCR